MNMVRRHYLVLLSVILFLLIKIHGVGIRLSDTNVYFYIGQELLKHETLYKDIFFTDLPLLPYIHALYVFLVGHNLVWFYFTATIEAIICSLFVYRISYEKTKHPALSSAVSTLYMFSFITLSTSDYQTGVFTASMFALLSYWNFVKRKYLWSGCAAALMLCTKAYFLPIVAVMGIVLMVKDGKHLFRFLAAFMVTCLVILLPFLAVAREQIYQYIVQYNITRTPGISKINLFRFFVSHDGVLSLLFLISVIRIRHKLFFGLLSFFTFFLILFYSDPYYLYLNIFTPFLCLSIADVLLPLEKQFLSFKRFLYIVIGAVACINILWYMNTYQDVGRIDTIDEIVTDVTNIHPQSIYATQSIGPAIAYLTHTPLLNNIIDTNANFYRKKILDSTTLTKEAVAQKSLIISLGAIYPEHGVNKPVVDEIFNADILNSHCQVIKSYPVRSEGLENRIVLLKCQ
jgi:hypothetical protein